MQLLISFQFLGPGTSTPGCGIVLTQLNALDQQNFFSLIKKKTHSLLSSELLDIQTFLHADSQIAEFKQTF